MEFKVSRTDVINLLISEGYLKSDKFVDKIKPFHGSCCCCQDCGYQHDDCVCESNELLELVLRLDLK